MGPDLRRRALALTAATAVVAVAVALTARLSQQSATTDNRPTAVPIAEQVSIVLAQYLVLDRVPGGGAVTTQAFDAFLVASPGRPPLPHRVAGVAIGTPVFDGRDRVAYWRRTTLVQPVDIASSMGGYDLVVWEIRADRDRVLLTLSDERPNADLLWSADRASIVVATQSGASGAQDTRSRLLVIDAAGGAARTLTNGPGARIAPVFADAQIVAGVRESSYVVIDASSGAVRTQSPLRTPRASSFVSSPDGTVFELVTRFEDAAWPLRIWNVRDPGTELATVEERQGIIAPAFWPGRSEVVFLGPAGIVAIDYRSGRTRSVVSPWDRTSVIAVEDSGRFALVRTDSGLQLVERVSDELRARPDLTPAQDQLVLPLGLFRPL